MPDWRGERGADRRRAAIRRAALVRRRNGQPEQPARPVREPGEVELALERGEQRRPRRGRGRTRQSVRPAGSGATSRISRQSASEGGVSSGSTAPPAGASSRVSASAR